MIETEGNRATRIVTIYDDIYNLPDARDYFRAMHHAGFRTAHHGAAAFVAARAELMRLRNLSSLGVLDFASGYGIAALLMRHQISLDAVLNHYRDPAVEGLTTPEMTAHDREWLRALRDEDNADSYAGLDIADQALAYGQRIGVFDAAFAEDLQADAPSEALTEWLSGCDLVVEIGSVAHMLSQALDRVLRGAAARKPWVITAPIRGNDTAAAMDVMAQHGLTVEALPIPPFRHRRFADDAEQARAIANAAARGHDPEGFETTGYFHAQLFLARPANELTDIADWKISPLAT
ncbi:hypothetical protein [Roseovarius pelagicus]|uniref:Methyltransferase domain-containing protein n=1 Tax=Roseovarius pelagicus TaxID=2980108 RepID=A0ABY6D973_9RHOB|nr:hypothetical protein [Roseovarius pelagicus]UXX82694.1 hypothetical protein N7U68_16635 [Roseovarius pelagicus]